MWEGPAHHSRGHPWAGSPGLLKKVPEQIMESKPGSTAHSSVVSTSVPSVPWSSLAFPYDMVLVSVLSQQQKAIQGSPLHILYGS